MSLEPRFRFPPFPPAIRFLLVVNVAVFVLNALLAGRLSDPASGDGGFWFAFSWSGLLEGYGLGALRFLSYQFTHGFRDPMHLLMNMLVLWFFGSMVEERLGARGTIRLYLAGGVAGALLHLGIAALQGEADVPLVGASGACYAFLLWAACQSPRATVILFVFPIPLAVLAGLLVAIGVYSTFVEFATGFAGGVSHGAHIGGAALGALAQRRGWFRATDDDRDGFFAAIVARWHAHQRERRLQSRLDQELRLDAILTKVKESGIGSLSAGERRFLERSSARARKGS